VIYAVIQGQIFVKQKRHLTGNQNGPAVILFIIQFQHVRRQTRSAQEEGAGTYVLTCQYYFRYSGGNFAYGLQRSTITGSKHPDSLLQQILPVKNYPT
jgi:hypothetical protein